MNPFQKLLMAAAVVVMGATVGRQVFSSALPPALGFGVAERTVPDDLRATICGTLGALDELKVAATSMTIMDDNQGMPMVAGGTVGTAKANVDLLPANLADELFVEHRMTVKRGIKSSPLKFDPISMSYEGNVGGRMIEVMVTIDPGPPARTVIKVKGGNGRATWCEAFLDHVAAQIPIQAQKARFVGPPGPK